MNKTDSQGNQVTIVIRIDDIMLTAMKDGTVDDELRQYKTAFGELKASRGPVVTYLGINFDFGQPEDGVKVSMSGFINKFFRDMDKPSPGIVSTPTGKELCEVCDSEPVSGEQREGFSLYK